jgi:hypothetical protein
MRKLEEKDPRVQAAIVLYQSGKAVRTICQELKMDGEALRRVLKNLGILRTRQQAVQIAKSGQLVREEAFDILTPEALYWIGFLYADGHIEKDRPRITLTLTEKDLPHLEKFAAFTGSLVRKVTGGFYRVCFSNKHIHNRLQSLGFTNRKTWDVTPHESLKYSRDFWRGVIDGDGWIFHTKVKCLGICGYIDTLTEFMQFINLNGVPSKTSPYKDKRRSHVWRIDLHHHMASKVATLLYKDADIYLDRKYQTYITEFAEPLTVAI